MRMYKVFYNNNFLLISDKSTKCNACLPINIIDISFINEFTNDNIDKNYIFITNNISKSVEQLKKHLNYIKAAGGLVVNNKKEILLIKHYNVWDLPKGWIEKNEQETTCALREVNEECGITKHKITNKLTDTFHIYKYNNSLNLKHTVWFLMNYNNNEILKPQIEEDISEIKWVKISDLPQYYNNMYLSIIDILQKYTSNI